MIKLLKEHLKQYKWAWYVHDKIYEMKYARNRKKAYQYMYGLCSKKNKHDKIRIGFLVQEYSGWDKQKGIYEEMLKHDNVEPIIIVVPLSNWKDCSIQKFYEDDNYFLKHYSQAIHALNDNGTFIDLRDLKLDYLFYPRPYDIHLPEQYRSSYMVKYTRCCHVPYGYSGSDVFSSLGIDNPFFDNVSLLFADSKIVYDKFLNRKYPLNLDVQKLFYLGYPALEDIMNCEQRKNIQTITWTPRWSYDEKYGGSNFLEYKDGFLDLVREFKDKHFIFRPHPLMFREFATKGLMSNEEIEFYSGTLKQLGVEIDMDSLINDVLEKTDLLISDFSSILIQFYVTGRPIVYCPKNIPLNAEFEGIVKNNYDAQTWEEVIKYVKMLLKGEDSKKIKRQTHISENYGYHLGASKRIVETIINDYFGETFCV